MRDGQVLAIRAVGVRKFGAAGAVTIEDRWHIGSCTKSMTATLPGILVEEWKVAWTTTVADIFPEVKMHDQWRAVTLAQLLTHPGPAADNPAAIGPAGTVHFPPHSAPIAEGKSKRSFDSAGKARLRSG